MAQPATWMTDVKNVISKPYYDLPMSYCALTLEVVKTLRYKRSIHYKSCSQMVLQTNFKYAFRSKQYWFHFNWSRQTLSGDRAAHLKGVTNTTTCQRELFIYWNNRPNLVVDMGWSFTFASPSAKMVSGKCGDLYERCCSAIIPTTERWYCWST